MRKFFVFLVGLIFFAILWFSRELFFGRLFCFMDLTYYFYPYRYFMAESIKNFSFPFWNPYLFFGYPFFAALQPGLFYPLSLIYFVFPFDFAFNLFLIIHYPLAAILMFGFLSGRGLSFWASVIGSITFAFSGYLLSILHMPTSLASVIWLPLIFLFWDRVLTKPPSSFSLISLIILLSIMFLGGEPTIFYGTILLLLFYILFFKDIFRHVLLLALITLLSLSLIAVQLFPFLELILYSVRAGGVSYPEATHWSMSPQRLLEFIIPFFFHMTSVPWASILWLKSLYLGIIPLILAACAFLMPDKKMRNFLFGALLLGLILAMGKYTPLYAFLFRFLPGFNQIRYPVKFLFISVFALAALSALGYDAFLRHKEKYGCVGLVLMILGGALIVLSSFGFFMPGRFYLLFRPLFFEEIKQGYEFWAWAMNYRNAANFAISGVFFILSGLIFSFVQKSAKNERLLVLLLPLMLFDLFLANWGLNLSINSKDYHVGSPNIEILMKDKSRFRVFSSPELVKRGLTETSDETINYKTALISIRDRVSPNQNMLYKIDHAQAYESIYGADQEELIGRIYRIDDDRALSVLDGLNIKYILTPYPFNVPGYKLLSERNELIKGGKIYLYRNQDVRPRQYEVASYRIFPDRKKLLDYMFSGNFDPRREILLEEQPDKCDRLLFISETFYPGWKAYVDGKEKRILRANYMFRAVPLEKGEHDIKFVYDPISFKLGALVSIITALGMIVFAIKGKGSGLNEN